MGWPADWRTAVRLELSGNLLLSGTGYDEVPPNDQASAAALQEACCIVRDGMVHRTNSKNRHGKAVALEAIVGRQGEGRPLAERLGCLHRATRPADLPHLLNGYGYGVARGARGLPLAGLLSSITS